MISQQDAQYFAAMCRDANEGTEFVHDVYEVINIALANGFIISQVEVKVGVDCFAMVLKKKSKS